MDLGMWREGVDIAARVKKGGLGTWHGGLSLQARFNGTRIRTGHSGRARVSPRNPSSWRFGSSMLGPGCWNHLAPHWQIPTLFLRLVALMAASQGRLTCVTACGTFSASSRVLTASVYRGLRTERGWLPAPSLLSSVSSCSGARYGSFRAAGRCGVGAELDRDAGSVGAGGALGDESFARRCKGVGKGSGVSAGGV